MFRSLGVFFHFFGVFILVERALLLSGCTFHTFCLLCLVVWACYAFVTSEWGVVFMEESFKFSTVGQSVVGGVGNLYFKDVVGDTVLRVVWVGELGWVKFDA